MINPVLLFNGSMTIAENMFNVIGYLPKKRVPSIRKRSYYYRAGFGLTQTVAGAMMLSVSLIIDRCHHVDGSQKYLTVAQQIHALGILLLNHGILNIARSKAEQYDLGQVLLAYDFYGRKMLPPLAPSFDVIGQIFERLRKELDRIHFITILPPRFCLRS